MAKEVVAEVAVVAGVARVVVPGTAGHFLRSRTTSPIRMGAAGVPVVVAVVFPLRKSTHWRGPHLAGMAGVIPANSRGLSSRRLRKTTRRATFRPPPQVAPLACLVRRSGGAYSRMTILLAFVTALREHFRIHQVPWPWV